MPTLDTSYFLMPPLQQCIFDKTLGTFLSAGIVNFFSDPGFTIPKDVFRLSIAPGPTFTYVNVGSTLTLSSIGSFVDENGDNFTPYLFPFDAQGNIQLYYIQVLDSNASLQFDVNAYPNIGTPEEVLTTFSNTSNVVTNPQFTEVNFILPSNTYSISGSNTLTNIAPNWYLITTGTGSVTVTQVPITDPSVTSNPPYYLSFTNWGGSFSAAYLVQLFQGSPRLLGNNFVNGSFMALSLVGAPVTVSMLYAMSGQVPQTIITGATSSNTWTQLTNTIHVTGAGSDAAPSGQAELLIQLPVGQSVGITSVQLVGVEDIASSTEYIEQSTAEQQSLLFSYWQPALNIKPIPSYLTGWDFPLNPAQIFGKSVGAQSTGDNTSYYAWDQTIIFQSKSGGVSIGGNTFVATAAVNTQFAVIQYLGGQQALDVFLQLSILGGLSSNVRVSCTVQQKFTISLWWTANASLPNITANQSLVLGLDANGHPNSVVGGWNEVARSTGQTCTFTTLNTNGTVDYGFNNWFDTSAFTTGKFFAIVIGSNTVNSGNLVDFKSISLVPGLIPTIPAPQTQDQVLRECQYYYEKSYAPATVAGTNTTANQKLVSQNSQNYTGAPSNNVLASPTGFEVLYTPKRVAPVMTFWTPAGTMNNVLATLNYALTGTQAFTQVINTQALASFWDSPVIGTNKTTFMPNVVTGLCGASNASASNPFTSATIAYHFAANAQLGVV